MAPHSSLSSRRPVIVLNFKAYSQSAGKGGWHLARAADEVARRVKGVEIVICPQASQLEALSHSLKHATVFAQCADSVEPGAFTGFLPIESIAASGAKGTLMNHAERKVPPGSVLHVVSRARKFGVRVLACADGLKEARVLSRFSPWSVAVEVPELIGTGKSVSTVSPQLVSQAVDSIRAVDSGIVPLVGAGVSTPEDVAKSIELGAQGVLLASRYVMSPHPKKLLLDMAKAALTASRS